MGNKSWEVDSPTPSAPLPEQLKPMEIVDWIPTNGAIIFWKGSIETKYKICYSQPCFFDVGMMLDVTYHR